MDSLDWSRQFAVLSISRLYLRDQLGFTTEQVSRLTDEDMHKIADMLAAEYNSTKFDKDVKIDILPGDIFSMV